MDRSVQRRQFLLGTGCLHVYRSLFTIPCQFPAGLHQKGVVLLPRHVENRNLGLFYSFSISIVLQFLYYMSLQCTIVSILSNIYSVLQFLFYPCQSVLQFLLSVSIVYYSFYIIYVYNVLQFLYYLYLQCTIVSILTIMYSVLQFIYYLCLQYTSVSILSMSITYYSFCTNYNVQCATVSMLSLSKCTTVSMLFMSIVYQFYSID